jgi:hypothetical protein
MDSREAFPLPLTTRAVYPVSLIVAMISAGATFAGSYVIANSSRSSLISIF